MIFLCSHTLHRTGIEYDIFKEHLFQGTKALEATYGRTIWYPGGAWSFWLRRKKFNPTSKSSGEMVILENNFHPPVRLKKKKKNTSSELKKKKKNYPTPTSMPPQIKWCAPLYAAECFQLGGNQKTNGMEQGGHSHCVLYTIRDRNFLKSALNTSFTPG